MKKTDAMDNKNKLSEEMMEKVSGGYEDLMLICAECGDSFVYTVGEQEYYGGKEMTLCPTCRSYQKYKSKIKPTTYTVICPGCGQVSVVPFKPDGEIYCSSCFSAMRGNDKG